MKKKKSQKSKEPYEQTLTKLKRLSRGVGLVNPRLYKALKEMASNKERVDYLKKLLSDNSISYNNLSEKEIKRLKTEFQLKREMEDLGIQIGTDKSLECEDGVPLSTRRPKRKRKVVNYRAPALKLDTEDEEGEENE